VMAVCLQSAKTLIRKLLSGNDAFYAWCPKIIQKSGLNTLMLPWVARDMSLASLDVEEIIGYELWILIHINKNSMKIKEYRSQFIQELLSAYDAGEAESFIWY
jgi:hypothetical protein